MRIVPFLIFACLFYTNSCLFSQGNMLGRLPVKNFSKKTFKGGTQTWDIAQDNNSRLYFANNDGLLTYDGNYWQLYPIGNNTIVRSVHIADDGKIYVGGQGEIGYFLPDKMGVLTYHSINHLIPEEYKNFADVWNIHELGDDLFFQTGNLLFRLQDESSVAAFSSGSTIEFSGIFNQQLYIKDFHKGLLRFEDNAFVLLPADKINGPITAFIPYSSTEVLVTTLKEGIFLFDGQSITPWNTTHDDFFKEKRIYDATLLSNEHIALATSLGGLLIIDKNGEAQRHIQKESGLQNANILCVFREQSNNLWLGLNNGIDYLEYESPFTFISPDNDLEGAGHTVQVKNNKIYFGSSTGLYQTEWKSSYDPFDNQQFQLVPNTSGQIWGLSSLGNDLILNGHEGTFQINGDKARPIAGFSTWLHLPLNDQQAVCGDYYGLSLFEKRGDNWVFDKKLQGLDESCRIMVKEKNGNLWMSHPYRGIYKIKILSAQDSVQYDFYNQSDGLPSDLINYVFSINGKALFATKKGVYQYLDSEDQFAPYPIINDYLGEHTWVKFLRQDEQENIWFVTEKKVGYLDVTEDGLQKRITKKTIPGLNESLVGGHEFIYPLDDKNVFFGAEKGFIHYDPEKGEKISHPAKTLLNKVTLLSSTDSLVFGGHFSTPALQQNEEVLVFKAHENALRFFFSSPTYTSKDYVQYQTLMKGMHKEWTPWSNRNEKEYTNLRPGEYTFMVRSKNIYGEISKPVQYHFEIKTPWYLSTLALIFYGILALGTIASIIYAQRNQFENEKEKLKSEHEEIEKQQQQIVKQTESELKTLRNEQLEKEVQFQKKELASATMHIMQKSEMIANIRDQLSKAIDKSASHEQTRKEVEKIIRVLQQDSILDDSWEQFTLHFDQVHSDFLKNLRETYPNLTNYDQKICAYLRMNLSTKEIATLMNISIRGVEGSRYRLRKKLNIPKEENLVKFIQKI